MAIKGKYFMCPSHIGAILLFSCTISLLLPNAIGISFTDSYKQAPMLDQQSEATFLKVIFAGGQEEFIRNWECPDGVWAEDIHLSRQPICACVKGAYAIASNLCDEDFKILAGDNHCFDIRGQTIRKFIPLIGKSGFAGRANTVFRKDAPYFARLQSSTPTTSVSEPMSYVFRMNDPNDFSIYAKLDGGKAARLKCIPGQNVAAEPNLSPMMQLVKLPNCSNEFRGPKDWCDDSAYMLDYQWTIYPGQMWSQKSGQISKGDKYPGNCMSGGGASTVVGRKSGPATATKGKGRKKRAAAPKLTKKSTGLPTASNSGGESKCDKFDGMFIEEPEVDTSADHFYQIEVLDPDQKFHPISYHQKLVNEQNNRIGHQIRRFLLDGAKGIKETPRFTNFPEFNFVQLSKDLLKKVCPTEDIPDFVVTFLIRAFRLLYIDSSKNYPYPVKPNAFEHKRIEDGLNKCIGAASPINFMGINGSCPELGVSGTNQSNMVFLYNNNLTLPGSASFNLSSMDVSIEFVWKLTLLSHYYCTEQFNYSSDLSFLFSKMEAMLKNPIMQFRWYYPGQFNRLLGFFLMTYDLRKVTKAIDRCVVTVYTSSNYTGWMTRPSELTGFMSMPKQLSHDVEKNIVSPTGNFGKSGRKKRFYYQDDIWQKQAYCMHTTEAPYNEVKTGTFLSCKRNPVWFDNTD